MSPATSASASASADAADHVAMQRVIARYAHALDQHDVAALAAVHTAGATWTFRFADTTDLGPIAGRDAIIEFVRTSQTRETEQHRHHLTNVVVDSTDGQTAEADASLLLTSVGQHGTARIVGTGSYRFRLRREGDAWRIDDLFLTTDNAW